MNRSQSCDSRVGRAVSAVVLLGVSSAALALPPKTVTVPYRSGNNFGGSPINSPFFSGANGGDGFRGVSVNNSAAHRVHVGLYAPPGFNAGVIDSVGGLFAPFLVAGALAPDPGSITVPDPDHQVDAVFSTAINNQGNGVTVLRLLTPSSSTITGIYYNKTAFPIRATDLIPAAGLASNASWDLFSTATVVQLNDSNTLLVASRIFDGSITAKNAIVKVQLNASGGVVSHTLVAKEGGPVGAGPDTWTSLAIAPHSLAMNNAGAVIFSGVTASGVDGLYLSTTGFVAQRGGASPVAGATWGPLAGSPVDLNNNGAWAVRATLAGQDSIWNEIGDAGETFSGFFNFSANGTTGGGMLRQINGSLSNDQDVDLYYVRVGNPVSTTQEPFSITTIPDAGSGFAGAGFDSVLYLFRDFHNANGAFRTGLGRSDNAALGVIQSALGAASLPTDHVPGTGYFLGISTPKSRAQGGFASAAQMWADDPTAIAFAGGTMYWIDPSEGQIRRQSVATGAESAPLQVGVIPPQTTGQVAQDAPLLAPVLGLYDTGGGGAGSKLYFLERRYTPTSLKRCNLDGSNVETVTDTASTATLGGLNLMQVDSANSKLYWTRPFTNGEFHRCNLDGTAAELLFALDGTRATVMAFDPVTSKFFYFEPVANSLNRCNLNGTSNQFLQIGTVYSAMAIDVPGRRLYLTTSAGVIRRINLDTGTFLTDLVSSNPSSVSGVDSSGGKLYWSVPAERRLRRIDIAGGAIEDWASVGADIGERPADGPAYLDGLNSVPFRRYGTAAGPALPYQIRMTGVTAVYPLTVISRGNTKIVATGDALPSTGPDGVTTIGALTSPVKISDNGLVAWRGRWISSVGTVGLRTAVFLDREEVIRNDTPVPAAVGGIAADATANSYGFDMSSSGQHFLISTTNGAFTGSGNNCIAVSFDTVPAPACRADFNGSGSVTVQDIFDFLAAYFTSAPSADINGSGTVTVQDIFDFLALYFVGC